MLKDKLKVLDSRIQAVRGNYLPLEELRGGFNYRIKLRQKALEPNWFNKRGYYRTAKVTLIDKGRCYYLFYCLDGNNLSQSIDYYGTSWVAVKR